MFYHKLDLTEQYWRILMNIVLLEEMERIFEGYRVKNIGGEGEKGNKGYR